MFHSLVSTLNCLAPGSWWARKRRAAASPSWVAYWLISCKVRFLKVGIQFSFHCWHSPSSSLQSRARVIFKNVSNPAWRAASHFERVHSSGHLMESILSTVLPNFHLISAGVSFPQQICLEVECVRDQLDNGPCTLSMFPSVFELCFLNYAFLIN